MDQRPMSRGTVFVPVGTAENSPALQLGSRANWCHGVPAGTIEANASRSFKRPCRDFGMVSRRQLWDGFATSTPALKGCRTAFVGLFWFTQLAHVLGGRVCRCD